MFLSNFVPDSLTGTIANLVLIATMLAVIVAPLVLYGYSSQIRSLMRLQLVVKLPESWFARLRYASTPSTPVASEAPFMPISSGDLQHAAGGRLAAIRQATWIAYAMFVVPAPALLWAAPSPPLADIVGFCVAVPMLAAVPALVNVRPQGSKTLVFAGMIVLGLVLGMTEPKEAGPSNAVGVSALLGTLYLVTAHRKLRSVVVLMAVWLTAALIGVLAALWLASPTWLCINDNAGLGEWMLAGSGLTLGVLTFTGFVYAGREAMRALARLVKRGFLSDISLAAAAGLTFIALLLAFAIGVGGPLPKWQIAMATGLWVSSTFGCYGWLLSRQSRPDAHRSLLVLRVFSKKRATEQLLDVVQTRWRYVGPVYEIAGTDLARLSIDPDEFHKFVSFTLYELFFMGAVDHQQLAARLETTADREGRFRVNQVFCFESAWRTTVEQLMKMSDAIVLDLRGFNRERQGAGFEIELLAQNGLLPRLLAVGDSTTDWQEFGRRIRCAGCEPDEVAHLQVAPTDSGERVVSALVQLATEGAAAARRVAAAGA